MAEKPWNDPRSARLFSANITMVTAMPHVFVGKHKSFTVFFAPVSVCHSKAAQR